MEGEELQWNHTQDALQAVYGVGQLDRLICKLGAFSVVLGAQYNRATLREKSDRKRLVISERSNLSHTAEFLRSTYCNNNIVIFCLCWSYRSGDVSDLCTGQRVWRLLLKRFLCFCRCGGGAPSCCINSAPVYWVASVCLAKSRSSYPLLWGLIVKW